MNRETHYTFSFDVCCVNIFAGDGDIHFHDYNTNETVCIEGVSKDDLHSAIQRYVHNIGVSKVYKEWLEEMHAEISSSLALLTATTES